MKSRLKYSGLTCLLLMFLVTFSSGCQEAKKPEKIKSEYITEQEKNEAAKKAEEEKQKNNARYRKMSIELRKFDIAVLNEMKVVTRSFLNLNGTVQNFIFSLNLDDSLKEQSDLQDKTSEIRNQFPLHYLEIEAYKFKKGSVSLMALEYRFMRFEKNTSESSSQFVVLILDKSLGSKALLKSQFEFPSQSDLKSWAQEASSSVLEAP